METLDEVQVHIESIEQFNYMSSECFGSSVELLLPTVHFGI